METDSTPDQSPAPDSPDVADCPAPICSPFVVDCDAYGREMLEYPTISAALADNRVVKVHLRDDGRFQVTEMCDEYFSANLTREQLLAWAGELRSLADSVNERGDSTESRKKP